MTPTGVVTLNELKTTKKDYIPYDKPYWFYSNSSLTA